MKLYDKHARTKSSDEDCLFKLHRINHEYRDLVDQDDRYLFQTAAEFEDFLSQIVGQDLVEVIGRETHKQAARAQEFGQEFFYGVWLSSVGENQKPSIMPFIHIPLRVNGQRF